MSSKVKVVVFLFVVFTSALMIVDSTSQLEKYTSFSSKEQDELCEFLVLYEKYRSKGLFLDYRKGRSQNRDNVELLKKIKYFREATKDKTEVQKNIIKKQMIDECFSQSLKVWISVVVLCSICLVFF
jgi:hypothetical protein